MKKWIKVILIFFLFTPLKAEQGEKDIIKSTFMNLKQIRILKKNQILDLLKQEYSIAQNVKNDQTLINFFHQNYSIREKLEQIQDILLLNRLKTAKKEYEKSINDYYLFEYRNFYDILFIKENGDVFYTIRKEKDYNQNIFSSSLSKTKLAIRLKSAPEQFFVDYDYYPPANQLAAFFITPVYKDQKKNPEKGPVKGWIVMQYSSNLLNNLLMDKIEVGNTGEVFLVNENYTMFTPSKFKKKDTSFKTKINQSIIDIALIQGFGEKIFKGYRGFNILSSFESFKVWGQNWVILSEIEEDEIITKYFEKNKEAFLPLIFTYISDHYSLINSEKDKKSRGQDPMIKVDMNEAGNSLNNENLMSSGISTCTGFLVSYPKKFSYLAHITPYDKIYTSRNITNFVRSIFDKILYYDIPVSQIRNLKIVIIANHTNSITKTLEKLINFGFYLSQIKFIYNPFYDYANIVYYSKEDLLEVEWNKKENRDLLTQYDSEYTDLGTIVKKTSAFDTKKYEIMNEKKQLKTLKFNCFSQTPVTFFDLSILIPPPDNFR